MNRSSGRTPPSFCAGEASTSDWLEGSRPFAATPIRSSSAAGSRTEAAVLVGFRLDMRASGAVDQSKWPAASLSQNRHSAATLANIGAVLRFPVIARPFHSVLVSDGEQPRAAPPPAKIEADPQLLAVISTTQGVGARFDCAVALVSHDQWRLKDQHLFCIALAHAMLLGALASVSGTPPNARASPKIAHNLYTRHIHINPTQGAS
jgi:hypothetical protein